MPGYEKFCYWLNQGELEGIRENLGQGEMTVAEEAYIPCRALRPSLEISLVLPSAWQGFCKRRTSWYGSSEKAGRFLVVSNRPLPISGHGHTILIRESDFKPVRLPTFEEVKEMAASRSFQKKKPSVWDKIDSFEKDFYRKWFERLGGKDRPGVEELLIYHWRITPISSIRDSFSFLRPGKRPIPSRIAFTPVPLASSFLTFSEVSGRSST
jgi:hypothetical protein